MTTYEKYIIVNSYGIIPQFIIKLKENQLNITDKHINNYIGNYINKKYGINKNRFFGDFFIWNIF